MLVVKDAAGVKVTTIPAATEDLGWLWDGREKSLNFKRVYKAPKVMKIGSHATQKQRRMTMKSTEFRHLCRLFSAHFLAPNACVSSSIQKDPD